MRGLLVGCAFVLACGSAHAAVSAFGSSVARDCFQNAQAGTKDSGLDSCNKALTDQLSDRDRAATYVNRGIIYNRTRQLDLALSDFGAALQLNQQLAEAYLNRGNTHFFRREFDAAGADYGKAIELKCANLEIAYYNRALIEEITGKYDDATSDLKSALAIKPDFKDATQQIAEVEKRKAASNAPAPANPPPSTAPDSQASPSASTTPQAPTNTPSETPPSAPPQTPPGQQ
jgi:tetratricopeptide (TPR) repeat protein